MVIVRRLCGGTNGKLGVFLTSYKGVEVGPNALAPLSFETRG